MKSERKVSLNTLKNHDGVDEKLAEIMASKMTLADYESKSFKSIFIQVWASCVSSLPNIIVGMVLAYSGPLIPALEEKSTGIETNEDQRSLMASLPSLLIGIGGFFVGPVMNKFGRINTIKLSIIPTIASGVIIAIATNIYMLYVGRILGGLSAAFSGISAAVYISEITRPDLRGALMSILTLNSSIGMELIYMLSIFLDWRKIAWSITVLSLVPFLMLFSIHESPLWLLSKGREKAATKTIEWIHKYHIRHHDDDQDIAAVHFSILKKEQDLNLEIVKQNKSKSMLSDFLQPIVYKPLLIMIGLFIIQQYSGFYIIIFYSNIFFKNIGTNLDPVIASNIVTGSTILTSIINVFTLKMFAKKFLMIYSCLGMGVCIFLSGIFTKWINEGKCDSKWVPILFIFLYMVIGMAGLVSVPWTMTAELFPLRAREVACSLLFSLASFIMFAATQSYHKLDELLGGSVGVQYFFGSVCFLGTFYIYFFVPETYGKKLSEIEDYFK